MVGVNYFPPIQPSIAPIAGVLVGQDASGWVDLMVILALVVVLVVGLLLVKDFYSLKRVMVFRDLKRFCKENGVTEVVCVISLGYLVLLNGSGEVVKGVYRGDLGLGFYEFLESVRKLGRELGVGVRWFNTAMDVDSGLVEKICKYEEGQNGEG
jgi:hypothetical protein